MSKIKLTDVERQILINQNLILSEFNSDEKENYIWNADVLYHGYEGLYDDVVSVETSVNSSVSDIVLDILNLYDDLLVSYQHLSKDEKEEYSIDNIKFDGFDRNEETDEYYFCEFILKKKNNFPDLKLDEDFQLNSHMPRLRMYINQLNFVEKIDNKKLFELDLQDIKDVMSAKNY